jgi:cobalt-zinc-cadmium efflux system protein
MEAGQSHGPVTLSGSAGGRHKRGLVSVLALAVTFMAVEVIGGLWTGSLALLGIDAALDERLCWTIEGAHICRHRLATGE